MKSSMSTTAPRPRLIVDGFTTDPETIVAGESFNLS